MRPFFPNVASPVPSTQRIPHGVCGLEESRPLGMGGDLHFMKDFRILFISDHNLIIVSVRNQPSQLSLNRHTGSPLPACHLTNSVPFQRAPVTPLSAGTQCDLPFAAP